MAGLKLAATMDAIAENLSGVEGIGRVYGWPADSVSPPAAVVGYPTEVTYDLTFGRGSDRCTFPVFVLVGKVSDRTARDRLDVYVSHAGAVEIKDALDGNLPTAATPAGVVQSSRVVGCDIQTVPVGGVDYLAARFEVDVIS